MEAAESPNASSESGTLGFSPARCHLNPARKRKFSHAAVDQPPAQPPREYGFMRDTGRHDTSRFVGSASGIHFIRSVYHRLARKTAIRSAADAASNDGNSQNRNLNDLVPGEDDQLRPSHSSRNGSDPSIWAAHEICSPNQEETPPSFDDLIAWSKNYFEWWHPTLPFLNAPETLKLFERVSEGGIAVANYLEQSIIRSIMSISLADSRQSLRFAKPIPPSLLFHTIDEAMSASQFALYQPASIKATQTALAIQCFLVSMLRLNAASRLGGLIVRMAFHLGLHRCPSRFPFFSPEEASLRRRVFWSVYCNERLLCQSLGLPLDIRDDDVDVCYPGEERHVSTSGVDDSRLQLLTWLAKHARIRGLILELRNKSISSRDDTPDHENEVQAELARWANEIHDIVEDEVDDVPTYNGSTPIISPAHRAFLQLLKYESMISLNRPMMASDPTSVSYGAGLQNCIFAARSIFILLKKHQARYHSDREQGATLSQPLLWPSITWVIWISAFILIYAASERHLSLPSALKHVDAGKAMLRHIAARQTSWPEYSLSAIDELTAAVRDLSQAEQTKDSETAATRPPAGETRRDVPNHLRPQNPSLPDGHTTNPRPDRFARPGQAPTSNSNPATAWPSREPSVHPSRRWSQASPSIRSAEYGNVNPSPISPETSRMAPQLQTMHPNQSPGRTSMDPASSEAMGSGMPHFMPGDMTMGGQEGPMVWYDQLFANSLGAMDYPALAAAQFDSSVDPTWSYLR